VRGAQKGARSEASLKLEAHAMIETVAPRLQFFDLRQLRVRAERAQRGERGFVDIGGVDGGLIVEAEDGNRLGAFFDGRAARRAQVEARKIGVADSGDGALPRHWVGRIAEIAREQIRSEIGETGW